jgi:hypothetical protein
MGKKLKREIPADASAAKVAEPVEAKERRFQWWQLLIGAAVALAAVLIPLLWNEFKSTPQFALAKPITRPDSGIVFVAQNRAASRKAPLTIEFDGFKFADAGKLIPSSEPLAWHFNLQDHTLPDSLLRDGAHRVRVGFAGEPLSEPLLVAFNTQAPVVEAEIIQPPGKPQDRVFVGRVASKLQAPAETLAVDVVFHHEGYPQEISVPVKRVTDETGLTYFEFETNIQGLPSIASSDPRYAEPFFAFRVTDQAGNQYFQQESYAQFMAPGDKRFGVNRLADIEVKRLPVDLRGKTKLAFRVVPKPKPTALLADGTPAIILKVTTQLWNVNQLKWTDLPSSVRASQPITIIFRDEGKLAIAFGNEYEDKQPPTDRETSYRVEQTGRDGQVYSSNTAKASPSKLPQEPVYLTEDAVKQMLKEKKFFHSLWNESGQGIRHQYEVVEREGEKLVIDHITNLTWQQSGSPDYMTYDDAEKYVRDLNSKRFGDYSDWRLPTLEEAMSLMESSKKNGDLYIDSVFATAQSWIWTADKYSASAAWVVGFSFGYCDGSPVDRGHYVRAVRGGQSNI